MKDSIKNFIVEALQAMLVGVLTGFTTYGLLALIKAISNKVKSVRKAKKEKKLAEKEAAKNKMRQANVDDITTGEELELSDAANKILKT